MTRRMSAFERHQAADPHCTCNDCIVAHFEDGQTRTPDTLHPGDRVDVVTTGLYPKMRPGQTVSGIFARTVDDLGTDLTPLESVPWSRLVDRSIVVEFVEGNHWAYGEQLRPHVER